ncbi:MAG: glycosyltransferase family 2 protein [Desulfobacterales bacterium]|nr:glycosyltransferase family 2 protein [Desulfobacterales bacterium]MDD4072210.1 glycosyltransferase family 2 protein [Desulfobacterales bacterium]MDD4393063.1 glycosyltransferase family 2 protein [Desulfobacterales bacterium]
MKSNNYIFDIIIVNYNSTSYLIKNLETIYAHIGHLAVHIVILDNNSRDDADRIATLFPQVTFIKNSVNMGFARAVNLGLKAGKAPYVVLLNPDSIVLDNFFVRVLAYMEKKPDIGIIGPRILEKDGSVQGSARSFPNALTGLFGRTSIISKWFPNNRFTRKNILTQKSNGLNPVEVDWVSGACMVVRRKAIETAGMMDERFFMYWEDADWCRQMWKNGWKVVYYPQTSLTHYVGKSSEEKPIQSLIHFHVSGYRLFEKYATGVYRLSMPVVIGCLGFRCGGKLLMRVGKDFGKNIFLCLTCLLIRLPCRISRQIRKAFAG